MRNRDIRYQVNKTISDIVVSNSDLPPEPTYSISQLNTVVREVLRRQFPRQLWIRGEIQDYDRRKHKEWVSFTLAEKDPQGDDILAKVNALLSPFDRRAIEELLRKAENGFQLQDGLDVRFRVEIDLWVNAGVYQVKIKGIDPTYTLGRLAQNRQRILEDLSRRDLIDCNKSLPLALVPLRIGLISAAGAAGLLDFKTHLKQSGFAFSVRFEEAAMQGPQVERDVTEAIKRLAASRSVDVIVIARGGGASADLSWFDRLGLAETVAMCPLPVLTGLGHTHDNSVLDVVAHANLKTPTDAAQFLIGRVEAFLEKIQEAGRAINERTEELLLTEQDALQETARRCAEVTQQAVSLTTIWLTDRQRAIAGRGAGLVERATRDIRRWREGCRYPRLARAVQSQRQGLLLTATALSRRAFQPLTVAEEQLKSAGEKAQLLDPVRTLKRGFSITRRADGRIMQRAADAKPGDRLTTTVSDGEIASRVEP